jgi:oligopeptidase B
VAKLRATREGDTPLYLKTHMDAGHSGASGRFEQLKETALGYSFALSCVGLA